MFHQVDMKQSAGSYFDTLMPLMRWIMWALFAGGNRAAALRIPGAPPVQGLKKLNIRKVANNTADKYPLSTLK